MLLAHRKDLESNVLGDLCANLEAHGSELRKHWRQPEQEPAEAAAHVGDLNLSGRAEVLAPVHGVGLGRTGGWRRFTRPTHYSKPSLSDSGLQCARWRNQRFYGMELPSAALAWPWISRDGRSGSSSAKRAAADGGMDVIAVETPLWSRQ